MPSGPRLTLARGEVHLWRADLDTLKDQPLAALLDAGERARAAGFAFAAGRRRFVVAHGVLRSILGRYLGIAPARVTLVETPHGRPELGGRIADAPRFSMSHSEAVALYALAAGRDVGVDVERVRAGPADDVLGGRVLSPDEVDALNRLPAALREPAFFRVWTRKEAYVKARGLGLALPLNRFTVSAEAERPALLAADDDDPSRWTLRDVDAGAGYAAALAVTGEIGELRRWEWRSVNAPRIRGGSRPRGPRG